MYVRGAYILACRQGLRPGEAHPLDAHMGRHVVVALRGDEVVLWPLHARGDPIQLPATAVWLAFIPSS